MRKLPARKLLGAVVAAALLLPSSGFTLGLGEIEVNSALNQRLNADIELLSATPEDAESIIIKLASRKEFLRAGIDRPYLLNDLRFKSEIINGVPHIKVTSASPIREPFLNFLVEIDWPNGHLLREYTVLLDPPVFMTQPASKATKPTEHEGFRPTAGSSSGGTSAAVPVATVPAFAAESTSSRPESSARAPAAQMQPAPAEQAAASTQATWIPAPVMQQQVSVNQPAGTYKVKSGDTAWSLADAMRPDQSITVPQMLVAMLRANPESFIDGNINGLKRGYILRVPDYNQITAINPAEAQELVREQAALWRQYQQSQAGGEPASAMEPDAMPASEGAAGADTAAAENEAYLEIVSAGTGSSTASGKDPTEMTAQELRSELALARERVETELVEKEALQQRINTLENNVNKMKGMLSIEDAELAGVEALGRAEDAAPVEAVDDLAADGQAAEEETPEEVVSEEAAIEGAAADDQETEAMSEAGEAALTDEVPTDLDTAETMADEAMLEKETQATEDESAADAVFTDEMSEQADAEMPGQIAPQEMEAASDIMIKQPQAVERQPADPLTQLLNNPMLLAAAGGGLLLIAALIGLIVKRRKSAAETAEPLLDEGYDDLENLAEDVANEAADVESVVEDEAPAGKDDTAESDFDSDSTMILDSTDDTIITEAESAEVEDEPRDDVIAEADVYLAYGIYQQAEELLTQAISDNPDRDDYRVKLAETHYASKNADAFTQAASQIKERVENDSATWKKVMVMGQDLCADNPMFQGDMVGDVDVDSITPVAPEMDFDLGVEDSQAGSGETSELDLSLDEEPLELPEMDDTASALDTGDEEAAAEPADELEFDLSDTGAVEEPAAEEDEFSLDIDASELDIDIDMEDKAEEVPDEITEIEDVDIDFGLSDETPAAEAEEEEEISLDLTEEAAELDMDLGLEEEAKPAEVEAAPEPEAAAEPVADLGDTEEEDFDLSSLDDVDEISTKLDLARAYLDMGDHEGTKGILEEVIAEGNDDQKKEAQELMEKLD